MKTKRPKTEDREPATLQGGGIVAAKIRCILMEDPGGPDEILTADNTRDVIREHYEDAAAQILQCWQSRGRDHREKLTKWKGGPCPRDMLTDALLTVWEYPGALGEIGLHYPPLRKRATVEDAAARVKSATDETDFAGQVEAEMNRRLPVIEAHGVIERGLRSAGVILSRAAADVADVSPAAIAAGLTALRRAYEPNPTGYGTASGVAYPSDNFPLWPDCMTGRDWQKLGEPFRGDLVRLRDSLVALNHTTGKTATEKDAVKESFGCLIVFDDFNTVMVSGKPYDLREAKQARTLLRFLAHKQARDKSTGQKKADILQALKDAGETVASEWRPAHVFRGNLAGLYEAIGRNKTKGIYWIKS